MLSVDTLRSCPVAYVNIEAAVHNIILVNLFLFIILHRCPLLPVYLSFISALHRSEF